MKRFALAGNPNSGKTTLFNCLTGSTAHVGNWPGVTVDKREGTYKKGETPINVVDLPGIYSLSPYTPEEVVSRNYILDEKPDCVIDIVDVTNLERNLYLTTQLMEIDVPVVVALNMIDVLEKQGDFIIDWSKNSSNALHVAAIDSPGLTCSVSIAQYVVKLLADAGITLAAKANWNAIREDVHAFHNMNEEDKKQENRK
jgi:small GTP-binding protein